MVFVGAASDREDNTLSFHNSGAFQKPRIFQLGQQDGPQGDHASSWPGDAELLIFDELHKYRQWKRFIKGRYDKLKDTYTFLVTGSARLDLYRRGGDSLQEGIEAMPPSAPSLLQATSLTAYQTSVQHELPTETGISSGHAGQQAERRREKLTPCLVAPILTMPTL